MGRRESVGWVGRVGVRPKDEGRSVGARCHDAVPTAQTPQHNCGGPTCESTAVALRLTAFRARETDEPDEGRLCGVLGSLASTGVFGVWFLAPERRMPVTARGAKGALS